MKLETNRLVFDKAELTTLNVKPGDRVSIEYIEIDGVLSPVIMQTEYGHKITKTLSIQLRNNANTMLAFHGDEFTLQSHDEGVFKLIGNKNTKIHTNLNSVFKVLPIEIITDTNYNLKTFDNYEF